VTDRQTDRQTDGQTSCDSIVCAMHNSLAVKIDCPGKCMYGTTLFAPGALNLQDHKIQDVKTRDQYVRSGKCRT